MPILKQGSMYYTHLTIYNTTLWVAYVYYTTRMRVSRACSACGFTRHESCAMQVKRMVMIQLINKVFKQYLSNLSS